MINHMAGFGREGVGSGGSQFSTMGDERYFPTVPYSEEHFTPLDMCNSHDGTVLNYFVV